MTTDAQILTALRSAGAGSVSGTDLSHQLGVSRAAIWARIEELRELGYDIEASPHLGYRLLNAPDVLHADDLISRLNVFADGNRAGLDDRVREPTPGTRNRLAGTPTMPTRIIGRDIRVFQETTSTNDVIEKLARDGVKEGAVVFAESQSKGRGRLGRNWMSPPQKGLWFSVLLRPDLRPQEATQLTVATATALVRAIRSVTDLKPEIKWPNDILIGGKKVAGVLTELSAELDHVKYIILGIGVNVNLGAGEFPSELRKLATSLKIEAGRPISRPELAAAILRELDEDYARIGAGLFGTVADEWEASCSTLGHEVVIRTGDHQIRGRAESLGEDGSLVLRTDHGRLERVTGGDVTLEK